MQGDPSGAHPPVLIAAPGDLLESLRAWCDELQHDADSPSAWLGLSQIFAAIDDEERHLRCRGIAHVLAGASPAH